MNPKTLIYIFLTLFLFSCESSKIENLIREHEQTNGNTKTDLNLKIQKLERVRGISVGDSIQIIRLKLTKSIFKNFKHINDTLNFVNAYNYQKDKIELLNRGLEDRREIDNWDRFKEHRDQRIKSLEEIVGFEKMYSRYVGADTTKEIVNRYKCTYTIKNPLLNGVKQEITSTYLVNLEMTKIIKDESLESDSK